MIGQIFLQAFGHSKCFSGASAQVSLGQNICSAPLTTQDLLLGGWSLPQPHPPPPLGPPHPQPLGKTLGRSYGTAGPRTRSKAVFAPQAETDCPDVAVELDPTACQIVLDNAVTNAFRHGCPRDPQVKLTVEVTDPDPEPSRGDAILSPPATLQAPAARKLRFLLTNRANPNRAPIAARWCSWGAGECLPQDAARPALSDGLGLEHIRLVASACGMAASLWQDGLEVFFELCVLTRLAAGKEVVPSAPLVAPFPENLHVFCLDDSPIARESLQCMLEAEVPTMTVGSFGANVAEVPSPNVQFGPGEVGWAPAEEGYRGASILVMRGGGGNPSQPLPEEGGPFTDGGGGGGC